jgi:hypothetical protein
MKTLLIVVALAALAYLGFKALVSGAPQGGLSRVAELPGVAISKLHFSGGNPVPILIVIGGVVLVLIVVYLVLSK